MTTVERVSNTLFETAAQVLSDWDRESVFGTEYLIEPGWWANDSDGGEPRYYPEAETADEAAQVYLEVGDWGSEPVAVGVAVWRRGIDLETGQIRYLDRDTIWVDSPACIEDEPECPSGEHDWQSPAWLGGCSENPGVWSTGGTGGRSTEVCARCGVYRHESWSGAQRDPGQPSRVMRYEDADARSIAWIEEGR